MGENEEGPGMGSRHGYEEEGAGMYLARDLGKHQTKELNNINIFLYLVELKQLLQCTCLCSQRKVVAKGLLVRTETAYCLLCQV